MTDDGSEIKVAKLFRMFTEPPRHPQADLSEFPREASETQAINFIKTPQPDKEAK